MSKTHPADDADRAKIASATGFNVHVRRGPADKDNRPAGTLIDAIRVADEMHAEHGKAAMIYAITPEGASVFVPPDIIKAARSAADAAADEAMKKPLTGTEIERLTALITGGEVKRANSKAAAEARFRKVATEAGHAEASISDLLAGPFEFASHIIAEHKAGKPMSIEQVAAAVPIATNEQTGEQEPADTFTAADEIPDCVPEFLRKGSRLQKLADTLPPPVTSTPDEIKARRQARNTAVLPLPEKSYRKVIEQMTAAIEAGTTKTAEPKTERAAPGKRAAVLEAAQRGEMPTPPDFSAETHARFRKKLAAVVAQAEAGNIAGLRAFEINRVSSSPKAIARYRDLCVTALEARQAKTEAA